MEQFWPFTSANDEETPTPTPTPIDIDKQAFYIRSVADRNKCLTYDAKTGLVMTTCKITPEQEWTRIAANAMANIKPIEIDDVEPQAQVDNDITEPKKNTQGVQDKENKAIPNTKKTLENKTIPTKAAQTNKVETFLIEDNICYFQTIIEILLISIIIYFLYIIFNSKLLFKKSK